MLVVVTVLAAVGLFSKDRIGSMLMPGSTIEVHFDRAYKLRPDVSRVKVAYVVVGKVTAVEKDGDGAVVTLKVEDDVLDSLGSEPSATIRPTTLLGGSYFVDLEPGGDPGAFEARSIPSSRTAVPVELDKVARALQPAALKGMQVATGELESSLERTGRRALRRLLETAPDTLAPAADVLRATRGERPHHDLRSIVSGLENTARALPADDRLDAILGDLAVVMSVLGRRSPELAAAIAELPETLPATEAGLHDLGRTLTTLREVSAETRPLVRQLRTTLDTAQPVIWDSRPLVADLRGLIQSARPLLDDLVPTAISADHVVTDIGGPVIDRVNRELVPWLRSDYHGKGPYSMSETDEPLYQELAYMFANLDRATGMVDNNGHAISFQPGVGSSSIGGTPISIEQMFKILTAAFYLPEPVETVPPHDGAPSAPGTPSLNDLLDDLLAGGHR
ncbi:MlaD family protein [Nocardioides pelophilus]|uniref:MlaD family protein n=1 Tax=Nocardioides pelophilus TaxID=2172019 RepID=UPI001C7EEFF3|nr:MlaD family protein [Nocardioides pelophilus]